MLNEIKGHKLGVSGGNSDTWVVTMIFILALGKLCYFHATITNTF